VAENKNEQKFQTTTSPPSVSPSPPPPTPTKSTEEKEEQEIVDISSGPLISMNPGDVSTGESEPSTVSSETTVAPTRKSVVEETYEVGVENDYNLGMSKLNASSSEEKDLRSAYYYLGRAAAQGHTKAREEMAIATLFGDYLARNITTAREVFEELSVSKGSPRSQFYLGFLYAAGLGVKSSQSRALTYFTFAALGGDPLAQMALGYRYWSGIGVVNTCEMALSYYKRIAASVAATISTNSVGTVIHRIRLYDEEEKISGQNQVIIFHFSHLYYFTLFFFCNMN
jgi:hypothetical protein